MATTYIQPPAVKTSLRLVSLDILRGLTIAFMILVNDAGSLTYTYAPLKHSMWNGWTPTDEVFPTFIFLVGISLVFSIESRLTRGELRKTIVLHMLRRAAILFALGLVVNGFPYFPLATLRIYGVLQRTAVCYLLASLLYLCTKKAATIAAVTVSSLLGYWILLRFVPVPGFGTPTREIPFMDQNANWVAYLDRMIFPGRLFNGLRDPEGLLSDLPSLATTLLGILTALWLRTKNSPKRIATGLFAAAIGSLVLGEAWNFWFPINKNLWTSSYVLYAAGWSFLALFACYFVAEIKNWKKGWTYPWHVFGSNAIVAYVLSELLNSTLYNIHLKFRGAPANLMDVIYAKFFYGIVSPSFGSLVFSLVYVAVCMIPVAILYHKKVFVKI